MTRIGSLMPKKFIAKEDISDYLDLTIKEVAVEDVSQENEPTENKPTLYFVEVDKGLVINVTNGEILDDLFGEIEAWPGQKVQLYVDPTVKYAGKKVGGIRVRAVPEEQPAADAPF